MVLAARAAALRSSAVVGSGGLWVPLGWRMRRRRWVGVPFWSGGEWDRVVVMGEVEERVGRLACVECWLIVW